jgi:O-antigen/teichoic acid export membrane protein
MEGVLALGVLQNLLSLGLSLPSQALAIPILQSVAATGTGAEDRGAQGFLLGQMFAILSAGAMMVLVASGAIWIPRGLPGAVWLLPVGICLLAAGSNLQAIAIGKGKQLRASQLVAILSPLQALWLLGWVGRGRAGLVPGVLLFGLVAFPATAVWLGIPRLFPLRRHWEHLPSWGPILAMGALTTVLGPTAQIVLRQIVLGGGLEAGANWQAAIRLSDILFGTWALAFSSWALPRLAARSKDPRIGSLSFLGAGLLAGMVLAVSPQILSLAYAHRFQGASGVLRLQAVAEIARALALPWALRLMARKAVAAYSAVEIGMTAFQLALAWWFVPRWGPLGAPAAVLVESIVSAALLRFVAKRLEAVEGAADLTGPVPGS